MILQRLRSEMKKENIDCYIIPTSDPHGSEYLHNHFKEREFITNFTGSAGTAVVTENQAFLWTDGRYFIQAESEIKESGFKLMKMGIEGTPTYIEWLSENLKSNDLVGLNGEYFMVKSYEKLKHTLEEKSIFIKDIDLIDNIWENRPELPNGKVYIHDFKFNGKSSLEKISLIRNKLNYYNANITVISSLDDIAWTLNIRGSDIKYCPFVYSYLIIEEESVVLFINKEKLEQKTYEYLNKICYIYEYDEIFNYLGKYNNKKFYIDKNKVSVKLFGSINNSNNFVYGNNITEDLKSIKNAVELENQKNAYIKDGVALTKFIYWLKNTVKLKKINEYDAALKLQEFRKQQKYYIEDSFETISAYGKNGAMMHYSANNENSLIIEERGFLLVDSGGQYLDGTTDITRTIVMGSLTEEEIEDFTYTLKSHFMLSTCKFLKGTSGRDLDILARYNLWKNNLDYKSGTGHGVGYFLNVHESPPSISPRSTEKSLEPGMIVTNEPGVYKEGKYGIRIENVYEIVEDTTVGNDVFYKFNVLSFAPIDIEAIDMKLLDNYEIAALNDYHKKVYEKISPSLNSDERKWLYNVTRELIR
ncbi:aminopeptidase P family protein [Anaerosphaera multitolerans]|uniref:Aminopeptidase P family protein n=1 Tax=Anaerosphaera multitolerans TaxID=2487351 RepID=A0A437S7X0_9FIRM|nr:aminopeptidase P family protein [Anaerosphaera multitolerans]RVU55180.1 aminopeptidase P family protein [Anaerosphaera multitolerans]